ncbi:MAG TPA: hypothetical protein VED85_05025, partial [Burkholderiaceae bacterium]|nr:hypothetical protein [Burkholderiaceae bacterium]
PGPRSPKLDSDDMAVANVSAGHRQVAPGMVEARAKLRLAQGAVYRHCRLCTAFAWLLAPHPITPSWISDS